MTNDPLVRERPRAPPPDAIHPARVARNGGANITHTRLTGVAVFTEWSRWEGLPQRTFVVRVLEGVHDQEGAHIARSLALLCHALGRGSGVVMAH